MENKVDGTSAKADGGDALFPWSEQIDKRHNRWHVSIFVIYVFQLGPEIVETYVGSLNPILPDRSKIFPPREITHDLDIARVKICSRHK